MVNFWTDHFNIDSSKGDCKWRKAADDRDVIRPHALGRFPDLDGRSHSRRTGHRTMARPLAGPAHRPGDLQVVHNYRNLLAPILSRHGAGARLATIFPEFILAPVDLY